MKFTRDTHLMQQFIYYYKQLYMFRASICPSSGVLGCIRIILPHVVLGTVKENCALVDFCDVCMCILRVGGSGGGGWAVAWGLEGMFAGEWVWVLVEKRLYLLRCFGRGSEGSVFSLVHWCKILSDTKRTPVHNTTHPLLRTSATTPSAEHHTR
jgi:hypothetical protein